jgi:hypothetical protein
VTATIGELDFTPKCASNFVSASSSSSSSRVREPVELAIYLVLPAGLKKLKPTAAAVRPSVRLPLPPFLLLAFLLAFAAAAESSQASKQASRQESRQADGQQPQRRANAELGGMDGQTTPSYKGGSFGVKQKLHKRLKENIHQEQIQNYKHKYGRVDYKQLLSLTLSLPPQCA